MATEREKEREAELESAMYTNCLLLGLDPAVLGSGAGAGSPRVGLFRHSNPKLGEQLLYFLLSALRGPVQSAKDFDKVWPIFDSAQSRDFRKIVQGIISELESQGALPRSNSRVSSLATCCGPRFVELLWQLSVHALREVHKRTFVTDVASNPLPASLTDVSYLHAASLLPVTKARIALERRKFLKNAALAVQRQNAWSNLAQEMTAEFRGLCAEEAYLQQELEKLQEMRNKAKLEGELWDDHISSTSGQSTHLVSKATRLWESILAKKGQHEVLASGPIEDLIAHREHRYRISGSSLLAAMDLGLNSSYSDVLSGRVGETSLVTVSGEHDQITSKTDDRGGRVNTTVDVAEILRRWTHALQRIHKQSLHLAKANDGEGPELLRSSSDGGSSGHTESLAATLAEHRQHLVSIQGLISQLKESIPAMQRSISELTEEANSVSSFTVDGLPSTSNPTMQSRIAGRQQEAPDEVAELTSRFSSVQLEKVPGSPVLKLPPLFSVTPNSSGKNTRAPKQPPASSQSNQESLPGGKSLAQLENDDKDALAPDTDIYSAQNIRRSVREAVSSRPSSDPEMTQITSNFDESQHFFIPMSSTLSNKVTDVPNKRKQKLVFSPPEIHVRKSKNPSSKEVDDLASDSVPHNFSSVDWLTDHAKLHQPSSANGEKMFSGIDDTLDIDQVFSPPMMMESTFFQDAYEDLLAPLSETDTALMDL